MAKPEISKSLIGGHVVRFDCPTCRERLRSPLTDAGTADVCPNCGTQFTVPGVEAFNRLTKQRQADADRVAAETERKRKEKQAKADARTAEREAARQRRLEEANARSAREAEEQRLREEALAKSEDDDDGPPPLPATGVSGRPFVRKAIVAVLVFAVISVVYSQSTPSGAGVTDLVRSASLRSKLKQCDSYGIVIADAYYDSALSTRTIVFDLLDGGTSSARRIDPVHLLLQFSDELDLASVDTIILARNGDQRFTISGADMKPLATSYANGGRPWAFNNLPASTRTMVGTRQYSEWSGGWLGVLQKQAEDLNQFIEDWTDY